MYGMVFQVSEFMYAMKNLRQPRELPWQPNFRKKSAKIAVISV